MSYSIQAILHNRQDKKGLHKVQVQVIYKRMKHYAATDIKVKPKQFSGGTVIDHPQRGAYNAIITKAIADIETRLLQALRLDRITVDNFKELVKGEKQVNTGGSFYHFADSISRKLTGRFTEGSMKHYRVIARKVQDYKPDVSLAAIDNKFMSGFEAHLRAIGNDVNTVQKNMQLVKSILRKAADLKLFDMSRIHGYKVPRYEQKLPVWLTEKEIDTLAKFIDQVKKPAHKTAGMYFLLSCYTGYRIGDAKRFDPKEMIQGKKVVLRADKNKQIVSIPIHKKLAPVIAYCKDHPLELSFEKTREYVKELASLAGIKKKIKFHSARHSFAMLLMAKGFTRDDVAELIGDTPLVASVYARVHNPTLDKKIRDKLG